MNQALRLFIPVSSLVLASVAVAEGIPGIDELVSLNRPLAWAISPNGKSIAYVVQSANRKDDRYDTAIWLATEGSAPFLLAEDAASSSFSPS